MMKASETQTLAQFNEVLKGSDVDLKAINDMQKQQLFRFSTELLRWNSSIRLTAATDIQDLTIRHIFDALQLLEDIPNNATNALDVGSGGGLPVIPLAILKPKITWTSLETISKKHAFLCHIKRLLSLPNFIPLNLSFEDYSLKKTKHDLAISRAVWPPEQWLQKARGVVRTGGIVLVLEASQLLTSNFTGSRRHYTIDGKSRSITKVINSP